jgi:excinuclease UvrABC nuclease subunit
MSFSSEFVAFKRRGRSSIVRKRFSRHRSVHFIPHCCQFGNCLQNGFSSDFAKLGAAFAERCAKPVAESREVPSIATIDSTESQLSAAHEGFSSISSDRKTIGCFPQVIHLDLLF